MVHFVDPLGGTCCSKARKMRGGSNFTRNKNKLSSSNYSSFSRTYINGYIYTNTFRKLLHTILIKTGGVQVRIVNYKPIQVYCVFSTQTVQLLTSHFRSFTFDQVNFQTNMVIC